MSRRRPPIAAMVFGGFAALLLVVAVAGALASDEDEPAPAAPAPPDPAAAWVRASEAAFAPFEELPAVTRLLDDWRAGTADPADVGARLAQLGDALGAVEPALDELGPHPDAPLAAPLHAAAAQLYESVVEVHLVAVALPAGEAPLALDLAARRLAVLANRVFDRGRAAVGEGPAAEIGPDVIVHRPGAVPSWADEGLMPGPPLATGASSTLTAVGASAGWAAAVDEVVGDIAGVDGLLAGGDADALLALAERLDAAVVTLRAVPDPGGGDRATRVLLGLLLRAEAARIGAAAAIVERPELRDVAASVAAVAAGDALWDDELGPVL